MSQLSTVQQKEVTEVLTGFGLNKKDQEVYLGLLGMGRSTLTPLSRKLGLPVTTVQSTMERLMKKGVIGASKRKSRHVYEAQDPSVFKDILKEQATGVAGILPLLKQMRVESDVQTRVRIFDRERVTEILNASLKCESGLVHEIVSAKPFQQVIGEKYHYSRRRKKAGVHLKSLRVRTTEIKKYSARTHKNELREARFLPKDLTFDSSILFWDNTVAILSTKPEAVHVMITSKSIFQMYQQLFDLLWSVSATMETLKEKE